MESVKAQTYKKIEVIVIDNHSSDETVEIARRLGAKVLVKGPERTAQLNCGIENAQGDYIYRIDSDFILSPDVVEKCVRKCEDDRYDCIMVPCISLANHFWAKVRWLERVTYLGEDLLEASRFFKIETIQRIGGFDEDLIANEDYDVQFRLIRAGARIGRIEGSAEWHPEHHNSLAEIAKRNYYYGQSIGKYVKKHRKNAIRQLFPIKSCYWKNRKLISRHPLLAIGLAVFQFVRYFSGLVGHFSATLHKPRQVSISHVQKEV